MRNKTNLPVDRDTASKLNPLVSSISTRDTLDQVSSMLGDFGYLLSQIAFPREGTNPELGHLYLLCETFSAAISYEAEQVYRMKAGPSNKESSHE